MMINKRVHKFGIKENLFGVEYSLEKVNADLPILLFVNAGIVPKFGPNHLYVFLCYKLAEIGYTSFRFDLSGIGESNEDNEIVKTEDYQVNEIKMATDYILNYHSKQKIIIIGLCSGAYEGLRYSLIDERVEGLVFINGSVINYKKMNLLSDAADSSIKMRYYKKNILNINKWLKIAKGNSKIFKYILRKVSKNNISDFRKEKKQKNFDFKENYLNNIIVKNLKTLFIFTEGSIFYDYFVLSNSLSKIKNKENMEVIYLQGIDHTFTTHSSREHLFIKIIKWLQYNE